MLTDSMADSRAAAAMMPTGPTATQIRDRAATAGTEGPPPTATIRTDRADAARDADARPIVLDAGPSSRGPEIARSVIENRMLPFPDTDAPQQAAPRDDIAAQTDQSQIDLAKAAFAATQDIIRQMQDDRAATMRIAM